LNASLHVLFVGNLVVIVVNVNLVKQHKDKKPIEPLKKPLKALKIWSGQEDKLKLLEVVKKWSRSP